MWKLKVTLGSNLTAVHLQILLRVDQPASLFLSHGQYLSQYHKEIYMRHKVSDSGVDDKEKNRSIK